MYKRICLYYYSYNTFTEWRYDTTYTHLQYVHCTTIFFYTYIHSLQWCHTFIKDLSHSIWIWLCWVMLIRVIKAIFQCFKL